MRTLAVPIAAIVLTAACGDTTFLSVSTDGRIQVVISSDGPGFDDDGFTISVDGTATAFQVMGSSIILTGLSQGRHSVRLGGLAENCGVEGHNPVTVDMGQDGTAQVAFTVHCARATTGGLSISVTTTGSPADDDGYLLVVGEGGTRSIPSSATVRFAGVPPGTHLVMLKNVARGCVLQGGNPQTVVVSAAETTPVALVVSCGPPTQ